MKQLLLAGLVSFGLVSTAQAAMLTPGNVLVSDLNARTITEYTMTGVFVQSFLMPNNGSSERLRDIVVDDNGDIHAYNGTFSPTLDSLDPSTSVVTSQTLAGWSTVNNISYGGIAVLGDTVFATDMATASGGAAEGIVRFSTSGGTAVRFATSEEYQDLTIGIDGLLYGLRGNNDFVDVFDPSTGALIRTINLDTTLSSADVRGIAVDANGALFAAAWSGSLYSADSDGNLLTSLSTGFSNLTDIDIDNSGNLLAGSRFGGVIFSDVNLLTSSSFTLPSSPTIHVAFTTPLQVQSAAVPEPSTFALLSIGGLALVGYGVRRKRQQAA